MPKSQQPEPLAHPPPLYRASQPAPLSQVSGQTLSPPTSISHYEFSLSPVSRTHHSRKASRSLDTSPNSDLSEFFPPQTGVSSPTSPTFSQSLFSPSLISPFTPRRPYSGAPSLILDSNQAFIQRKSLSEIQILTDTQYSQLRILCSDITISPYDSETWEVMLDSEKFPSTNSGQDAYDVEMITVSLSIEFASNNKRTANFNTLLLHALSQMRRVIDPEFNGEVPVEAYNSLFLVRVFSKHFIGNLSRDEIHRLFEGNHAILTESPKLNGSVPRDENKRVPVELNPKKLTVDLEVAHDTRLKAEQLIDGLLTVILKLDPVSNASAYEYYQECLNILLVLLSTQIHQSNASQIENNYFLNILLTNFSDFVNKLTKRLLANFIEQKPPPPASTSVVYNAYSYLFPSRSSATLPSDPPPISERSLLILLLLSVQCRVLGDKAKSFREGIRSLKDAQGMEESDMAVSFRALYQLICRQLPNEEICLILYLLMIENEEFRVYVLSRLDPEILLLQILRLLYDGIDGGANYSQMYILLTILLLFSQDEVFNENIQKIVSFYKTIETL